MQVPKGQLEMAGFHTKCTQPHNHLTVFEQVPMQELHHFVESRLLSLLGAQSQDSQVPTCSEVYEESADFLHLVNLRR